VDKDEFVVDVMADHLVNIAGFQFFLRYDNYALGLISASSTLIGSSTANFGLFGDEARMLYTTDIPGITLPDNSILATFRFSIKKISADVTFSFRNIEFVNSSLSILCVNAPNHVGQTYGTIISGRVTKDDNNNCSYDVGEKPLSQWIIELTSGNNKYYRITDDDGSYSLGLPSGQYSLMLKNKNDVWSICQAAADIFLEEGVDQILDFSVKPIIQCPIMFTSISTPFLRRCFNNNYTLKYENQGTTRAENAWIEVVFDDNLNFINTDFSNYSISGQTLIFYLSDLEAGEGGKISITFLLNCENTTIGQTHCVTSTAFPNDPCIIPASWSGAVLSLDAICDPANDKVIFTIKNTGNGPMANSTTYIVTEDDVMMPPRPIRLAVQEELSFDRPANGSTYRLSATQDRDFPSLSPKVTLAVEGCGTKNGTFSRGFVTLFEESDRDLYIDKDCRQSIGSYDPNDILGLPKGYGIKKYIEKDVEPEYTIRFQNTGTDTAFTVVIKNLIPESLDITSLQLGTSSHPYSYKINYDRELVIRYDDIRLVDSTKNELLSHGFIKYKISPASHLTDDDIIYNKADIYFDFNPPVRTNTEYHTIGKDFIITSVEWVEKPLKAVIYPNPTQANICIDLKDEKFKTATYQIININGQVIQQGSLYKSGNEIPCLQLVSGQYILKIVCDDINKANIHFIKI
jgi:hypothetical protein